MVREKKNSQPLSMRMDQSVFERLKRFCEQSGQSKTTAIERAVVKYIDDYDELIERVKQSKF